MIAVLSFPEHCLSFYFVITLFVHFSISPIKISVTDFWAFMRAKVFKFCIHIESGQVYCGKENHDAEINFCLLFACFLFSISHSNVIHREICVKDFSGTTEPRTLKFGTNVGYNLLYCVRENQPPPLIIPFICPFFFLSNKNFCPIFLGFYERESSNFVYTLRVAKYIVGKKIMMLRLIFAFFLHFSFFPSLTQM